MSQASAVPLENVPGELGDSNDRSLSGKRESTVFNEVARNGDPSAQLVPQKAAKDGAHLDKSAAQVEVQAASAPPASKRVGCGRCLGTKSCY